MDKSHSQAGESSRYILDFESVSSASPIFAKSSVSSCHFASFQLSTHIAAAMRRSVSCSLLISSENIATLRHFFATFCAKFRAMAVLPIDGRAARITRSPRLNQPSLKSSPLYPVDILLRSASPGSACIAANSSYRAFRISRSGTSLFCIKVCVTQKRDFSHFSRSSVVSAASSYPYIIISFPARTSFRRIDLFLIICAY